MRNYNKVYVIGHQTVRQHIHIMFLTISLQPVKISQPILVREEHIIPPVPALGDMMG